MKDHGPKGLSAALPSSNPNELGQPGPLKEKLLVIQEGNDSVLLNPDPNVSPTPTPSKDLVIGYVTAFPQVMASDGITKEPINNLSLAVRLYMERTDIPLEKLNYALPDNADTLLRPAVVSVLKYEPLLREELPSVMRKENVPVVRTALGLIDGYTEAIDIVEPFYLGLLARRRQAQGVADGFCRRIYKDGSPVILGNTVLDKGLLPLQTLCTVTSQTAQDTAHLKATVAHEIEAKTLGRLEEELLRQGTTQTPLVGAHAPGQVAVPPGAMPLITLPQPQHPKPKRRGTPAPPKKKGPPGTSAPKKSKKKGT